jgi:hypothetical protein
MPSRGKWVADPILHGGVADPHWMCNGRWTPPYTDQAVHAETPLDERRPANAEENWSHWDRTESVSLQRSSRQSCSEKSPRSWHGRTRHSPGACQLAPGWTRLGKLAQSRGSWALDRTYARRQAGGDSGAMQILANAEKHVDAVPNLAERVRNEVPFPLQRASQPRDSPQRPKRRSGGNEFGISPATGRVVSAFRRGSFEVTALDERPLSCRGSCG